MLVNELAVAVTVPPERLEGRKGVVAHGQEG
jgi:hypothetical protein